jgi:Transposase DDE domain group 1
VGEAPNQPFQLSFNASLKIDFQGSHVTSDGGLILVRELDERLGSGELIQQHLTDSRRGKNTQFALVDLLRQSVYSRLAGYEDLNDAERLSHDPAFRLIGSEKIWDRGAALTSRLQSFETEMLAEEENLAGLAQLNRDHPAGRLPTGGPVQERRGVVPTGGVHCDQPDAAQPGGGRFYNKRGTSEQWIKEGKQAVKMTRLSCHRFRSNEVRLWLSVIAYNLGNLWRRLVLPKRIDKWSLTSLQQRLVKTGGRVSPVTLLALGSERPSSLPTTPEILLVWYRSHSAQRCERHRDPHRRSAQVSASLSFRPSPAL